MPKFVVEMKQVMVDVFDVDVLMGSSLRFMASDIEGRK